MSEVLTNKFVMDRDFIVKGYGYEIGFKSGEPMHVPPILHTEAMRCGARALDPAAVQHVPARPSRRLPEIQGEERADTIIRAIKDIVSNNRRMDFGANGLPTTQAIHRLTGLHLEQNERNMIWREYKRREVAEKDPNSNTITAEETAEHVSPSFSQDVEDDGHMYAAVGDDADDDASQDMGQDNSTASEKTAADTAPPTRKKRAPRRSRTA